MVREGRPATLLELGILGLLKEQELHGYELKKRLSERLGFTSGVSFGTLYPALARLEGDGLVRAVEEAGAVRAIPLTGSLGGELAAFRARAGVARGGRSKKVYAITDGGAARFGHLLNADLRSGDADLRSSDEERMFSLRLAFARFVTTEVRVRLLERRRGQLLDRLHALVGRLEAGGAALDTYARTLMEHDREVTERDISWIERLIAAERAGRPAGAETSGAAGPETSGAVSPPPSPTEVQHQ